MHVLPEIKYRDRLRYTGIRILSSTRDLRGAGACLFQLVSMIPMYPNTPLASYVKYSSRIW
jgi:hypothetical protein